MSFHAIQSFWNMKWVELLFAINSKENELWKLSRKIVSYFLIKKKLSGLTINKMIFNYLLIAFDQEDQLEKKKKKKSKTIYYTFVNNSMKINFLAGYKRLMCIVLLAKNCVLTLLFFFWKCELREHCWLSFKSILNLLIQND